MMDCDFQYCENKAAFTMQKENAEFNSSLSNDMPSAL